MGFIRIRDRLKELQVLKKSLSQDSLTVKALKTKLIYLKPLTMSSVLCVKQGMRLNKHLPKCKQRVPHES